MRHSITRLSLYGSRDGCFFGCQANVHIDSTCDVQCSADMTMTSIDSTRRKWTNRTDIEEDPPCNLLWQVFFLDHSRTRLQVLVGKVALLEHLDLLLLMTSPIA